jgi:2-polyprenyl-3-methyl-5-hydroxy-6-metoxy-1,4-benzoquinol methylase
MNTICKICNSNSTKLFTGNILNKYIIDYFQCDDCNFIQTEKPYWLNESYSNAIASTDIGLLNRNNYFQNIASFIITSYFDCNSKFLDYAGGYGVFVRLMRDNGFNFYRQDMYCENIFAKYFDISDCNPTDKFELITAFEVFEHLTNPIEEIGKIFEKSDALLFSTELQPKNKMNSTKDWWYFAEETGQHISFYTIKSLEIIAAKMNCNLYSNNTNLHILTKRKLKSNPFEKFKTRNDRLFIVKFLAKTIAFIERKFTNKYEAQTLNSLLMKDFEYVKSRIKNTTK